MAKNRGAIMGSSMAQLRKILKDVCDKTGVCVRLAPAGEGETSLSLEFCGERCEGSIAGTDGGAQRAARLVEYLVANADARTLLPDRDEHLKEILLGEGGEWYAFRFVTKYALRDGACFAVDIVPDKRLAECFELVKSCIAESRDLAVTMDRTRIAVVRFPDGEQSASEFGQFVWQSLYEELGVHASIGIGCEVVSFSEIAHSYSQAVTAVRVSEMFHDAGEVHSYREYLLVRMLEDVPKSRLEEYVAQFRIGGMDEVFADEEMYETAEAFLESSLNVSETSRNLYMHRNTLMYRLDKIERITGLNIRKFSDAVTFRILSVLHRLLGRKKEEPSS